ncbi:hypothetical protein B0H19DRAFT_1150923 [Mycena capillaripes]|nr:hypothetical protein B0H19DRAFT_1150923 [Mycena capillaripes]
MPPSSCSQLLTLPLICLLTCMRNQSLFCGYSTPFSGTTNSVESIRYRNNIIPWPTNWITDRKWRLVTEYLSRD